MTSVVVVSEIALYRDGIAIALEQEAGIDVVATGTTADDAVRLAVRHEPEVVVLDTTVRDSREAVRELAEQPLAPRIIAIAMPDQPPDVIAYAEAGVAGWVSRADGLAALRELIAAVMRGETICSSRMAAALLDRVAALSHSRENGAHAARLTPRETQVADLVRRGMSNKEIAARLHIEVATVKNHVHSVLEKLELTRRGEIATQLGARRRIEA